MAEPPPNVKIIIIINVYYTINKLCEHNLFNVIVLIAEINAYYYVYLNVRGFGERCPPMLK